MARLGDLEGPRVLVATDCLSEGINLQEYLDAVVHYDLSWNPTRHEQREGRVDRFGQPRPVVRATLMYGVNNPVDGAVLEVILRKAERIRKELGVPVPVPDEGHTLTQALLKAVLLRRRGVPAPKPARESSSNFSRRSGRAPRKRPRPTAPCSPSAASSRRTCSRVAQEPGGHRRARRSPALHRPRPDPARLGARASGRSRRCGFKAPTAPLPEALRERLESEGLTGTLRIDFRYPATPPCRSVQRSHPLVAVLAETLLERSLNSAAGTDSDDPAVLGRVGCWVSAGVRARTTLALLRLRHQLVTRRGRIETTLLVEEATGLAWVGQAGERLAGAEALALLANPPVDDVRPTCGSARRPGPWPGSPSVWASSKTSPPSGRTPCSKTTYVCVPPPSATKRPRPASAAPGSSAAPARCHRRVRAAAEAHLTMATFPAPTALPRHRARL